MNIIEAIFGTITGYITWTLMLLIKAFFILLGVPVLLIVIPICVKLDRETLPWFCWPWKNTGSGYHNRGFGKDYKNPLNRSGGDASIYKRMRSEGKSNLYIALNWSIIRNPANMITRKLGCMLSKIDKRIVNFTSFQKHAGKEVSYRFRGKLHKGKVQYLWSPFPERIRAVIGLDWYMDFQLVRAGIMYYPMLRVIKCHRPRLHTTRKFEFFKKADGYDRLSKLMKVLKFNIVKVTKTKALGKKHTEIIIGFKLYAYMVDYAMNNKWMLLGGDKKLVRTAAINFVYRYDEDWA